MAQGEKLNKALEWFDRAVGLEEKGNHNMVIKCLDTMVKIEKEGLEAGESWD